jgi:hypothetical protein
MKRDAERDDRILLCSRLINTTIEKYLCSILFVTYLIHHGFCGD